MEGNTFYITTPIYYPSDRLHIGHAYTTIIADSLSRWNKFIGRDVLFVTGSDEHGQKIQRIAKEKGVSPQEYVDEIVASFQHLWQRLGIEYDDFVRTTQPRHYQAVQEMFRRIYDNGDIYKGKYEGWYCTPCETFWVETKLDGGNCPDCGRPVELVQEESYFFKLSNYSERLLQFYRDNPDFIQPESRRSEMINFVEGGLEDLCVSRTGFDWGIPVPMGQGHVIYVWFDALTNYLTALGFPEEDGRRKWWPADLHLVGKEIMRFHTIYWPIMLMAAGEQLPKTVFGHGWLLFDQDKMSKSKGNVVDPHVLIDEIGVDPIRYFLLREVSIGQDGNFSRRALIERTNSDLANDLGNSLHRSLAMLKKYFDGVIPAPSDSATIDRELQKTAVTVRARMEELLAKYAVNDALVQLWQLVSRINKYIDEAAPWNLAKDENSRKRLGTVMYNIFEAERIVALLVKSFVPETAAKMWQQLGIEEAIDKAVLEDTAWGGLKPNTVTQPGSPLFPRMEAEPKEEPPVPKPKVEKEEEQPQGLISINDFTKVNLVVAKIQTAQPIKGADKLLKLVVDIGPEQRQIVAGIAAHYRPEELAGRTVVVVKNLKPVKLRGELSEGMLLAASDSEGRLQLVTVPGDVQPGSAVK